MKNELAKIDVSNSTKFILNGSEIETKKIKIQDDGKVYDIDITM